MEPGLAIQGVMALVHMLCLSKTSDILLRETDLVTAKVDGPARSHTATGEKTQQVTMPCHANPAAPGCQ